MSAVRSIASLPWLRRRAGTSPNGRLLLHPRFRRTLARFLVSRAALVARLLWTAFLELLASLVALALAPLFYWRLLTSNPNDAATPPFGDFTDLHYPYRRWIAEQLARGEKPFWNAFVSSGHSAIGDIQFQTLYPPNGWFAQIDGAAYTLRTLELDVVAHVALGTLFAYLLARRLTGSRVGGLVTAIVFGFGGYLAGFPVQQVILLETSVWLPLILLCVDVGADRNLVTAFVLGAGALGMAALAGHPQTLFYVGLAAGLYLLYKGWNGGRIRWATLPGLPILFVGGAGLAAVALIPAYAHLGLTDRTDVSYAFSSSGFALHEAIGALFPVQFGGAALYNGIFTLLLVAIALGARRRRADKVFWTGLAILGLLLSFGGATFLQSLSYLALGSFKFRDYERLAFLFDLAVAVLAGFGASELTSRIDLRLAWLRRVIWWPLAGLAVFMAFTAVQVATTQGDAQSRATLLLDRGAFTGLIVALGLAIIFIRERRVLNPAAAGLLAVLLVAVDLFSTTWQSNLRPGDPDLLLAPNPIVEYLESYTSGLYRIASEGLLPGDGNAGDLFRLEDVVGNSPLETLDYGEFTRVVPEWTRWQILNVRYVVTKRKFDDPRFHLLRQDGPANLYEIDETARIPRAYVVHQTIEAPNHQTALAMVKDVDLREVAVVENRSAVLQPGPDESTAYQDKVDITSYRANTLSLTTTLNRPGLLVLSEVAYPGWQASVDGATVPVLRADGIIRAVSVPSGKHEIRFWFVPPGLQDGEAISALGQRLLLDVVILEIAAQLLWHVGRFGLRVVVPWARRPRGQAPGNAS